jgi:hypothetical protein
MLIEAFVLDYLKQKLDTENIYVEMPQEIPDSFAVLTVVGRGKENQIEMATIEVQSYGITKYVAASFDELIRQAMEEINEEDVSCRFGGGNDNPDTTIKMPRYRSYFNLYF